MEDKQIRAYKRRNYFIDKEFQSKFILKFCGLVILGGALTIALLYLLAMKSTTVAFVNSRVVVRATSDFILPLLVQTVVVVTILVSLATIIVTLFVSHKIAGPLYRFKKVIQALEDGDFSGECKIRRLDQLQDFAHAFNSMIGKLRIELKSLKDNITFLKEMLDGILEGDISVSKRQQINAIKNLSLELARKMNNFKV